MKEKLVQHTLYHFLSSFLLAFRPQAKKDFFQFSAKQNEIKKWRRMETFSFFVASRKYHLPTSTMPGDFKSFYCHCKSKTSEFISFLFQFFTLRFLCFFLFFSSSQNVHRWGHRKKLFKDARRCSCFGQAWHNLWFRVFSVAKRCFLRLDLIQESKKRNCLSSIKEPNWDVVERNLEVILCYW